MVSPVGGIGGVGESGSIVAFVPTAGAALAAGACAFDTSSTAYVDMCRTVQGTDDLMLLLLRVSMIHD